MESDGEEDDSLAGRFLATFSDDEFISTAGMHKFVFLYMWNKYGPEARADSPIKFPYVTTPPPFLTLILAPPSDGLISVSTPTVLYCSEYLYQVAFYTKIYPVDRAVRVLCPRPLHLPRHGQDAKKVICRRLIALARMMDDLDQVWLARHDVQNDMPGLMSRMHRFMVRFLIVVPCVAGHFVSLVSSDRNPIDLF